MLRIKIKKFVIFIILITMKGCVLFGEKGKKMAIAQPGSPVEILGFDKAPSIGGKVEEGKIQAPQEQKKRKIHEPEESSAEN